MKSNDECAAKMEETLSPGLKIQQKSKKELADEQYLRICHILEETGLRLQKITEDREARDKQLQITIEKQAEQQQKQAEQQQKEAKQRQKEAKQRQKEAKRRQEEAKQRQEEERQRHEKFEASIDKTLNKMGKKLDQFIDQFTSQWGRMIEELVKPASVKLFKKIGIDIDHAFEGSRHRRENGQEIEVDVILVNTTAVVAIEVKTTLRKDDVDHFICQMAIFQDMFREFKGKTIYGAMAAMRFNEKSDIYAKRQGLFVLRANSDYAFKLDDVPIDKRKTF